jgi:hypothetical protein
MNNPARSALRGTGRTTRMLMEAASLGMGGKTVFVVAMSSVHARDMMEQTRDFLAHSLVKSAQYAAGRYELERGGQINFTTPEQIRFDWDRMRATTYGPDTVYLIDHHVIETRFRTVLEMLHRWDPRPEEAQEPHGPDPDRQ